MKAPRGNILSIDVEEIFHGEFVRKLPITRNYRADETIPPILDLLERYETKATFFCVGNSVSDQTLIDISDHGHEIGFHTEDHIPLWEKTEKGFLKELFDFQDRVMLLTGQDCVGFRAPSFSLDEKTEWAFNCLKIAGFRYDSSIFPIRTPLYGMTAPKSAYIHPFDTELEQGTLHQGFQEYPLSVGRFNLPVAGGFYLRAIPEFLLSASLQGILFREDRYLNLFIHNWELVPPAEKIKGLPLLARLYCYYNLKNARKKFERILATYLFGSFKDVIGLETLYPNFA